MEPAAVVTKANENGLVDRFKRLIGEKAGPERRRIAALLAMDLGDRATAGPESAQRVSEELKRVARALLED